MMNLKHLLKEPFELPDRILKVLEENSEFVSFLKNQEIIRPGDTDVDFYIIASGLARIYHRPEGEDGCDENLLFGERGNIAVSPTSFMLGCPAVMGIAAVTKLTAYKVKGEVVKELYRTDATFCRWLLELSMLQLAYLEIRYQYLAPRDAYQRYLNFMRFKTKSFIRRVPGYHIASYLDISPTTLSLLRARYAHDEEKKVEYDKEFLDAIGMTGLAPE